MNSKTVVMEDWINVKDELPKKGDTSEEYYNEVLTLQLGTKRPVMVKYWEVERNPFITHWLSLPPKPPIK